MHHLQIIGEAGSRLSAELIKSYPRVPWKKIIGMRNILVHKYFEVDLEIVWDAVVDELPPLKQQIQAILNKLREQE